MAGLERALQASPEKTNFMKLTRLLIRGGTLAVKELFDSYIPPRDLSNKLRDPSVKRTLQKLKGKNFLTKDQWDILYPSSGDVNSKSFDISLLYKLLRNVCVLTPPATGWNSLPNSTDTTLVADFVRIKHYRNKIYGHEIEMEVSEGDFKILWKEIKDALLRIFRSTNIASIADHERAIDNCFAAPVSDDHERDLRELKSWFVEEIAAEVKEMVSARMDGIDEHIRELRASIEENRTLYPVITPEAVCKLVSVGTWAIGSAYILYRYKEDPEEFLNMVNGFVLPTGLLVYAITKGSIKLQIQVEHLNGLEEFWSRYQTGQLKKDLEKVMITEELKELAHGDAVELDVFVSEDEYKKARELLEALHHSDDASHEGSDSKHDKDDPPKSTEDAPTEDAPTEDAPTEDHDETPGHKSPTLNIVHGKQFQDGKSTFQVHLAFVTSQDQVDRALKKLDKKTNIADATYRIRASRIFNQKKKSFIEECEDYDELEAGTRLLRLLEMIDARNVAVVLTCWQKGTLLRPVGRLVNKTTLELLQSAGLFTVKSPSEEKEVLEEVDDYFEFIKQHVPKHPSFIPVPEAPKVKIHHGSTVKDKQSTFQAHLAFITRKEQVEQVLAELKKDPEIAEATYNICAYRVYDDDKDSLIEDFDDDDECFAGESLLHLLKITDVKNVVVIVSRWHGRIALGRARFKYINQSALELLQTVGLVEKITSDEEKRLFKEQEDHLEHLKQNGKPSQHTNLQPKIKIIHGEKIKDRKSTFQAHLAVITSRDQVDQVLKELKKDQEIVNATYNIRAYRIYEAERKTTLQDGDDDGEYLAGASLLHLLEMIGAKNVMVVVTRWHGGILLGRDRFKHVNQCALNVLQKEGMVERLTPVQEEEILEKLDGYFEYAKQHAVDYYMEIPKSSCPKIIHGACLNDRKSTFQAHIAEITSPDQVKQVFNEVKKDRLVAKATYNILAYRIFDEEKQACIQDFDDGGEVGAGEKLLSQLKEADAKNVVAVVTRWHGGILLGSARFQHINESVGDLLKLYHFIH